MSAAFFAGKDLSGTDLRGAFLWGADLRHTKFRGTLLRGAELIRARFYEKDMILATLEGTELSYFVLKMRETQKLDVSEFMRVFQVQAASMNEKVGGFMWQSSFRDDLFFEVTFLANGISDLEDIREQLAARFATKVAVYFDECEQLAQQADSEATGAT
jgi:uncharacterized protein YjbI with pentapeptide repeats